MSRRSRRRRLPSESFSAQIQALSHDGRGIAYRDGKRVLIHGALPGEEVLFNYTAVHKEGDQGQAVEVLNPSPDRVAPDCQHFGVCGGCCLQHLDSKRQIEVKQAWLLENLATVGKVEPDEILPPLTGPVWGYRQKARLGVRYVHKKGRVLVGFRERNGRYLADLQRCSVLHIRVGELLEPLAELIQGLSIRERLPQIEVALGDTQTALSFRVLDPPSDQDRIQLTEFAQQHDLQIYLQPQGPESTTPLWPREPEELSYELPTQNLTLAFKPYHFTQVNSTINRQMLEQAIKLLDLQPQDRVLDLFCGLGNFTLALARHAGFVTGVEGDQSLVDWADANARRNQIEQVEFHAADLSIELDEQPWLQQDYDKILLDPPRSGALELMPYMKARRVVYVSCHPATLARDVGELVHRYGYRLHRVGIMDMFPHTAHVESIALLLRE